LVVACLPALIFLRKILALKHATFLTQKRWLQFKTHIPK